MTLRPGSLVESVRDLRRGAAETAREQRSSVDWLASVADDLETLGVALEQGAPHGSLLGEAGSLMRSVSVAAKQAESEVGSLREAARAAQEKPPEPAVSGPSDLVAPMGETVDLPSSSGSGPSVSPSPAMPGKPQSWLHRDPGEVSGDFPGVDPDD